MSLSDYMPKIDGLHFSGEKQDQDAIFFCSKCQSKRTVRAGKTIPKCSKCNDYTYWIKAVTL
jgi:ribosomal protein L37AE/L43A